MSPVPEADPRELRVQKELLQSPVGSPGSGYDRYAAAMYFYNRGILSPQLLEIFRRCCKYDWEDPIEVARHEGVPVNIGEISKLR